MALWQRVAIAFIIFLLLAGALVALTEPGSPFLSLSLILVAGVMIFASLKPKMKISQTISGFGIFVVLVSIFEPWLYINVPIFGNYSPSLYNIVNGNYGYSAFQSLMDLCLVITIITIVLGISSIFKKMVAAGAVFTTAITAIVFFIGLDALESSVSQGMGLFLYMPLIINANIGAFTMIFAGALFIIAVFVKDNGLVQSQQDLSLKAPE